MQAQVEAERQQVTNIQTPPSAALKNSVEAAYLLHSLIRSPYSQA